MISFPGTLTENTEVIAFVPLDSKSHCIQVRSIVCFPRNAAVLQSLKFHDLLQDPMQFARPAHKIYCQFILRICIHTYTFTCINAYLLIYVLTSCTQDMSKNTLRICIYKPICIHMKIYTYIYVCIYIYIFVSIWHTKSSFEIQNIFV